MKKKNFIRLLSFFIIFFIVINIFNIAFAGTFTQDLVNGMKKKSTSDPTKDSAFMYLLSSALTLLQFIGTGISLIIVTKLGITYMICSVEEKAEIKKKAVPIVCGCVLITATVNILKFIQEIVKNSIA